MIFGDERPVKTAPKKMTTAQWIWTPGVICHGKYVLGALGMPVGKERYGRLYWRLRRGATKTMFEAGGSFNSQGSRELDIRADEVPFICENYRVLSVHISEVYRLWETYSLQRSEEERPEITPYDMTVIRRLPAQLNFMGVKRW